MAPRLFISFSGGRTSAYMTKLLLDLHRHTHEVRVLFANTGQEHENTLRFVDDCDRAFNFNVVWIESVTDPRPRHGVSFRLVDYFTASRDGRPFEDTIRKHGIPGKAFPHCTRELKVRPMTAYLRSIGWKSGSYQTAVGIRADEADRISSTAGYIYPLIPLGVTKAYIRRWWSQQKFDLQLPEHLGNCTWCWKKSRRKLLTLVTESPTIFDFPARMESLYPFNGPGKTDQPKRFFRGHTSVAALRAEAAFTEFTPFVDTAVPPPFDDTLDVGGACGDSCEIGADE